MPYDQIYIGAAKGLKLNPLPFNIDNESFAMLYNAYTWRQRVKRKRGTVFLGRLQKQIQSVANATPPSIFQSGQLFLSGGARNLFESTISGIAKGTTTVVTTSDGFIFSLGQDVTITGVVGMTQINGGTYTIIAKTATTFTLDLNSTPFTNYSSGGVATLAENESVTPGTISFVVNGNTYTEPSPPDGTLLKNGSPDPGSTIDYATGDVTIASGGSFSITGTFSYFPGLPVMGLEDFTSSEATQDYPVLLAFDTRYSYQVNQTGAIINFYNVNYYKYSNVPFTWSGADYQQFWTTNYPDSGTDYQGSLWATNNVPGFNFVNATYTSGSGTTTVTFNFKSGVVNFKTLQQGIDFTTGDQLWFNEWTGTINGKIGYVSDNSDAANGNYVVTFANSVTVSGSGIAQLLTNTISGQDGIKWYDGDPTSGTGLPTVTGLGWVNFAPPLSATATQIDDAPAELYYLVGALAIVPFKDRLIFFSPWIQTSDGSPPIQLRDTALWSWNGTPYYTAPVPTGQTFDVRAYYVDQTGFGGYLPAGVSAPIKTISNNEDVLLVGFGGDGRKTRFVYTSNDIQPFLFYNINSELPSGSTFSSVTLDKGAIDIGAYGIAMTDQQSSQRIDLDIPDSVFQIQALNNGVDRVNAIRDYFKEWIYFSYPLAGSISPFGTNNSKWKFPTQTFLFNYRDNTWGILYENFTKHGYYRAQKKKTWKTTGFATWNTWREPWNSGTGSPQFPNIVAGNPQGFVLIKGIGTGEAASGAIQAIASAGGLTQITSINHCVAVNDYLYFAGALGSTFINTLIGKVISTPDADNFVVDIPYVTSTYEGLGTYARLSQPLIQTKQFPFYWEQGRKVRLSVQRYLMDFTQAGQVTVNIYLSQDPDEIWNDPTVNVTPSSLIYSQIMYTCPESNNIGLTPANFNLQMPTAEGQYQIWHRFNTSLIGDSVQVGISLSDTQMRNLSYATDEITLHAMHLSVQMGPQLA